MLWPCSSSTASGMFKAGLLGESSILAVFPLVVARPEMLCNLGRYGPEGQLSLRMWTRSGPALGRGCCCVRCCATTDGGLTVLKTVVIPQLQFFVRGVVQFLGRSLTCPLLCMSV